MNASDYFGFAAAFGFGCWWLVFPRSVVSFYTWFHRGRIAIPKPSGIRVAGAIWIVLVGTVMVLFLSRKP